jgi:hypothetical protein
MPRYLVIETWPSLAEAAICDPDSGKNLVYDDYDAAEVVALDCQEGKVVKIGE